MARSEEIQRAFFAEKDNRMDWLNEDPEPRKSYKMNSYVSPWEEEGSGNANARCHGNHIRHDDVGLQADDHYHEGHRPLSEKKRC